MYVQGQWAKEHIFNRLKTTVRSTADKKINIRDKTRVCLNSLMTKHFHEQIQLIPLSTGDAPLLFGLNKGDLYRFLIKDV